jgi:tetratricopeptide (TPR) repeat protein
VPRHPFPLAPIIILFALATFASAEPPTSPRLDQINALLAKDPENAMTLQDRGHAYALLGLKTEALADLRKAAALAPTDDKVLNRIAWSYFNLREYARALEAWLESARLSGYQRYYDYYAVALGYWGVGDGMKATAFYNTAVEQDETFGEWKTLVERTESWTWAEKDAIYRLYDAWRRGYKQVEEKQR